MGGSIKERRLENELWRYQIGKAVYLWMFLCVNLGGAERRGESIDFSYRKTENEKIGGEIELVK